MVLHVLVVEDNDYALNRNINAVLDLSKQYDVEIKVNRFTTINQELRRYIREHRIDMAFLDIEVGKFDGVDYFGGIDLAEEIRKIQPLTSIIFITSHGECVSRAVELLPVAFLSKPLNSRKLEEIFYRIIMEKSGQEQNERKNARFLEIKVNKQTFEIQEADILYMYKWERKVMIITKKKEYIVNTTLNAMYKKLVSAYFVKISRDTIVNKLEIDEVQKGTLIMSNEDKVPIPVHNYAEIISKLY